MSDSPSIAKDIHLINRLPSVPTILEVVARTTGMRFTAVARVTDTTWTACAVRDLIEFGLKPGGELGLETTICNEIRQHHQPVVFGQASTHPIFATHATPKMYGFESYVSIPIFKSDGEFWGTLCAIDPLPAKLDDPNVIKTLELFAQLIASQLEAEERHELTGIALLDANETSKLRDQFIAVLGHDLRNPLQAITMGVEAMGAMSDPRSARMIASVKRSCARMSEMIHAILDFARGRLGAGIPVSLQWEPGLPAELNHVIVEIQVAHPDHQLDVTMSIAAPVYCDRRRLGQLLGNLLQNAIMHGSKDRPIRVSAIGDRQSFALSVSNYGKRIDDQTMRRLFKPFTRSANPHEGLGLGLYIASEIAKAHGGTLSVTSKDEDGTTFTFALKNSDATEQLATSR
jgi:signal transduction histidine kinase